jgi:hypothetical protein
VEGGHELAVRVERHLGHPGLVPQRGGVDAALLGEDKQGALGRIADHLAVA